MDDLSEQKATELRERLHQSFARSGIRNCLLLIDTRLRRLEPDHLLAACMADAPYMRPAFGRVDREICPRVLTLDTERGADSLLIGESIVEAWQERIPARLAQGGGRRIAGWLASSQPAKDTARHLAHHLFQNRPGLATGTRVATLLHFYDPAVLWLLWLMLDATQRATLFGPVREWWFLDPIGEWATLRADPEIVPDADLNLSDSQWADILSIGAINTALRAWLQKNPACDLLQFEWARRTALSAARRARGYGWHELTDLAPFVLHALLVHPLFDRHPRVRALIDERNPDDRYGFVVDALGDIEWQNVRTALEATDPPAR